MENPSFPSIVATVYSLPSVLRSAQARNGSKDGGEVGNPATRAVHFVSAQTREVDHLDSFLFAMNWIRSRTMESAAAALVRSAARMRLTSTPS